ncbi:DUF2255 family protein [Mammaliicoccus sciuri]|uniref:DUF2255 family protein n=1 Tax=Mammaliicoccus sciuri TaxID=1296 RepID=UPI0021D08AE9|nr:DUF2255 family protein [Mammaliicoccus sciuri]UXV29812.1 DUF2255 family protein [Mammaliicoccus sciuri]
MLEHKWSSSQLEQFKNADDMYISPFYDDGVTLGTPTWIWSVVSEGDLYVRGYNGQNSRWYQSAKTQQAGQIKLANQTFDVNFEALSADSERDYKISEAYKEKYKDSPYLAPMINEGPVSATVKITPRFE